MILWNTEEVKWIKQHIIRDGKDIVVVANEKEVFRKPKTTQTVAIAHDIYMAYKYENGRWRFYNSKMVKEWRF